MNKKSLLWPGKKSIKARVLNMWTEEILTQCHLRWKLWLQVGQWMVPEGPLDPVLQKCWSLGPDMGWSWHRVPDPGGLETQPSPVLPPSGYKRWLPVRNITSRVTLLLTMPPPPEDLKTFQGLVALRVAGPFLNLITAPQAETLSSGHRILQGNW